jgi:peptidyl-prolyl cis-trans isomerase SurA
MKNLLKLLTLASSLTLGALFNLQAQEVQLDRLAAIVNSGVVLESEVEELINNVTRKAEENNQSLPSDLALRTQVLDKLIGDSLIMQIGDRMGIQVSDAHLDQTLTNIATDNKLTLEQFRQDLVSQGLDYEKYRETVRTELITGEVRRSSLGRRINISPQEIDNLLSSMKEQTNNDIEYELGHILIEFPAEPNQEDLSAAKTRADKVIDLLKTGSDFNRIAIASSGDANALQGGNLGWKNINEMPTLFSELVDGKEKDTVIGPIRTGLGFSIVKVLDIRGRQVVEVEEVKSRHILVIPTIILSDAKAEALLQEMLDKIKAGDADFAELAKEHSDDSSNKLSGGDLGWAKPTIYDPLFADALARLDVDQYSKPFRSSFGWHITQLTGRRTLDATKQMNENKAYQMLYNRQYGMESARWLKELRDEAFIEIFEQDVK